MEFLKDIFGGAALTYDQLAEKLNGNKDIKIGNLAGGAYVSREKLSTVEAERDGLRTQLSDANKKLEGFDPEWKSKSEQASAEADKKVQTLKFDYALNDALRSAKVKDPVAVKAHLKVDALKLDGETILGLKEQLETVKKESGFLFEEDDPGTPPPRVTGSATGAAQQNTGNEKANAAIRQIFGRS